ncbi:MAG: cytochrome c oxidase accessory protein CcoG, partial [Xanthobacteraceae bacterium]|nr:cytochrome c oxidase accessory protein CcoG [Xanthobacteraceae bacterium]
VRIVRPRTLVYVAVMLIVGAVMLTTLATRASVGVNVIHDRNPMFVRLSGGAIRNAYTMRILNKATKPRSFAFAVTGIAGASVDIVGIPTPPDGNHAIEVGPDQTREVRVLVTDHQPPTQDSSPITFTVIDRNTGEAARTSDHYFTR